MSSDFCAILYFTQYDRQCTYKCIIEALLRKDVEKQYVLQCLSVCQWSVMQHAEHMHLTVICSLSGSPIPFYIISQTSGLLEKIVDCS